jgi:hypothetical protein
MADVTSLLNELHDLHDCLLMRSRHGFGFEVKSNNKCTIMFAQLDIEDDQNQDDDVLHALQLYVRNETDADTFTIDNVNYGLFLCVFFMDWDRIPAIMNTILRTGRSLTLNCALNSTWPPLKEGDPDYVFTWHVIETRYIRFLEDKVSKITGIAKSNEETKEDNARQFAYRVICAVLPRRESFYRRENYLTEEGGRFFDNISRFTVTTQSPSSSSSSFSNPDNSEETRASSLFKKHKLYEYGDWWGENTQKQVDEELDESECIICMDAPADTLVLPCGHICVCKNCSSNLSSTNIANRCACCMTPIDEICTDK